MLHVRMVRPASFTGQLTEPLAAAPSVHNVVVQAGPRAVQTVTRSNST